MVPVSFPLFPYPGVTHGPWPSSARHAVRPARGHVAVPGMGVMDGGTDPSL